MFPNRVNAAAFERVKLSAGVLVGVATLVVNKGERLLELKALTEPAFAKTDIQAELIAGGAAAVLTAPVSVKEFTADE